MTPEDFLQAYEMAIASQDWNQLIPLIHENASVRFSTGAVHHGIRAIEKAYKRNFSLIEQEVFSISDVHWLRKTDTTAVYFFSFHWHGILHGKEAAGAGYGTTVLWFEDGRWQLIAEHLSV